MGLDLLASGIRIAVAGPPVVMAGRVTERRNDSLGDRDIALTAVLRHHPRKYLFQFDRRHGTTVDDVFLCWMFTYPRHIAASICHKQPVRPETQASIRCKLLFNTVPSE